MQNDLMCKRKVMSWVWSLASNIQTLSGPTFTNLRPRHIGSLSHSSTKGENPAHVHYLRIRGCPLVVGHVVTSWFVRFREAAICSKCWFESGSSPQSFFFLILFFKYFYFYQKKKKIKWTPISSVILPSCINVLQLLQLMSQHWCSIIN